MKRSLIALICLMSARATATSVCRLQDAQKSLFTVTLTQTTAVTGDGAMFDAEVRDASHAIVAVYDVRQTHAPSLLTRTEYKDDETQGARFHLVVIESAGDGNSADIQLQTGPHAAEKISSRSVACGVGPR